MKYFLLSSLFLTFLINVQAQVSINPFGIPADQSALLDISHDAEFPKGILIPRMDLGDILNIPSPAAGLMAYDTLSNRFMYYNGLDWIRIGEGHWFEVGPGIQSSPEYIGIGLPPDLLFSTKINSPTETAIGAFSGQLVPTTIPNVPAAVFGYGVNGSNGGHFEASDSGIGLLAANFGSGHTAKFLGGKVYIENFLGIGIENPASPLFVDGTTDIIGSFESTLNTTLELRRNGQQEGLLKIIAGEETNGFRIGKETGMSQGDVSLYNQGRALTLRHNGWFSFQTPGPADNLDITLNRDGVEHGSLSVSNDAVNAMNNVLTLGKPSNAGDLRFRNGLNYMVMEADGDVGIGTNSGSIFNPVENKLRVVSNKTTPAFSSNVSYTGTADVIAIEGKSVPAPGWGYGGRFEGGYYGLFSEAKGTTYAGDAIGVYAKASGSTGTRIALYATASGGTENWAGFFANGKVHIASTLLVGSTTGGSGYKLSVNGSIEAKSKIDINNANGDLKISLDTDVNGDSRITTDELQINGGSDFAERFDINNGHDNTLPTPGMLVSIDPLNPGQLHITSEAYDRKVAGIISGANGIKPGVFMGQLESIADGEYPVSLSGRVYVYATDENGPITPGDLLTSSSIPGHAMKVKEGTNSSGSIVGKAMTSLHHGQGFVLTLVSLQ